MKRGFRSTFVAVGLILNLLFSFSPPPGLAAVAPSGLTASLVSATRVDLAWTDNSPDETGFRIERSANGAAFAAAGTVAANVTLFSDTAVQAGNSYAYRVVSTSAAGDSAPSNVATVAVTATLQVGPIDAASIFQGNANSGYPLYYQDDQGVRVGLIPITGNGLSAPTQIFDPPAATNPYSAFLGFGTEAFYYNATAVFNTSAGKALAVFGVEASFATAAAQAGQEIVFMRTRIKAAVPAPGAYTFQHPWGSRTINVTQADIDGGKGLNFTEDIVGAARTFNTVTTGPITRFLRQTVPPPPAGWIGDGVAVGPVTGSPTGFNAVKITGPVGVNLDGAGNNFVQTNQFAVSGRLATPAAATGLTATAVSTSQINLSWTDNAATETGYRVERATDNAFTLNVVRTTLPANTTVFNDATVAAGTTFFYRVFALSGLVDSLPSNVAQATTPAQAGVPPPAPTGLAGMVASATQINLSWTDNAPAESGYRLERATDSAFTLNVVRTPLAANTTTFNDTTVTAGTTYFYRVFALNGTADSLPSNVAQITVPGAATAPAAPGGLTAAVTSATRVDLTWTDNSVNETGFRVERSVDGVTFASAGTVAANIVTFGDTTVQLGNTFFYRVIATNAAGDSLPSNVVSTTVAAPAAPADLAATLMSATRVDLLWTDNSSNESTFRIERSLDNFATAPGATFSVGVNQRTFSDTTVAAPNTYFYRVMAVNGVGPSAPSNVATVTASAKMQVGPIDPRSIFQGNPNTGFPGYYQDDQGVRVGLVPITGDGLNPPTQIFDEVVPTNPYSVFLGFGTEGFYYMASASFNTSAGRGFAEFAIEAAFANGPAEAGQEMVFNRTRVRIDVPVAGTYTLQHPYGTETFEVTPADIGVRGINLTRDIGIAPRDFTTAAAAGNITRFLRQTTPPPPAGWIGDGASVGPVTGSPTGFNAVRLTGPVGVNLDGAGNNFVQTNQFDVSGRLLTAVPIIPSFSRSLAPVTGIAPATVTFTDASTGAPLKWSWDFGDGTTSALQNPTKTYSAAGKYLVKLTATNAAGSATTSQVVNIYSAPVASFTNTLPNGLPPVTINFTDTSTGNPASWSWDFGDGSGSSVQNPSKVYAAAGAYTVRLTVTNPAGSNSATKVIGISSNLIASFTKSAASGVAPLTVTFTDTSVGTITGWLWNFGDGTTSNLQNPPPKTYTTPGNFTVTLTITDAQGSAATSQVVSVSGTLAASFTRTPAFGRPPLTVNFTDTSTGNPTSWSWAFGDGTTSALQNPTKTYTAFGVYTVTLTVTNLAGTASASQTVIVTTIDPATLKLQVGPIDPASIFQGNSNTGWPSYYQDDQGTRVALLPIIGDGINAPTQVFDAVNPASPYSAFLGFGTEAFYYMATAGFNTSAGRGLVEFAVEAAFGNGPAEAGQEMVFTRTRVRIDVPAVGTYTLQHPYGTDTFTVTAADVGVRGISSTVDIGAVPRDFLVAGTANVSRFLRQTAPLPPAGWIGDGAAIGPVTGSPTGFNAVKLTGPTGVNLDGAGNNFVQTNQFSVSGRLFVPTVVGPPGAPPAAPTGLTAALATTARGPQVNLSWVDNATTETGYRVERATNSAFTLNVIRTSLVANAIVAGDIDLTAGTTYFYRVFAVNGAVDSAASNVAQVTVPGPAPAAPSLLTATAINATQVNLSWTDNAANETGFRIDRAANVAFTAGLVQQTAAANAVSFSDLTVSPVTTYFYRVVAVNANGVSAASNTVSVTTPAALAPPPAPVPPPGGAAPPPAPGTVSLTGLTGPAPLVLDTAGTVQTTTKLTPTAGPGPILTIAAGTRVTTTAGAPVTALSAAPVASPPPPQRNNVIVVAFDFGPDGTRFSQPITLTLSYNPATLPAGVREQSLKVAYFDSAANKWVTVGGTVNTTDKTVTVNVDHFTVFAIQAEQPAPAVTITSPKDGATVPAGNVTVRVEVSNFQLEPPGAVAAGKGHLHYYMDVTIPTTPGAAAITAPGTYKAVPGTSVTWEEVAAGKHTFGVQLVSGDHRPLDPPVTASVSVTVSAPAPAPTVAAPSRTATPAPAPPAPGYDYEYDYGYPAPPAPVTAATPMPTMPPAPVMTPEPEPATPEPAVVAAPEPVMPPAVEQPAPAAPPEPTNWPLIAAIIAAVIVVAILFYLYFLRVPKEEK